MLIYIKEVPNKTTRLIQNILNRNQEALTQQQNEKTHQLTLASVKEVVGQVFNMIFSSTPTDHPRPEYAQLDGVDLTLDDHSLTLFGDYDQSFSTMDGKTAEDIVERLKTIYATDLSCLEEVILYSDVTGHNEAADGFFYGHYLEPSFAQRLVDALQAQGFSNPKLKVLSARPSIGAIKIYLNTDINGSLSITEEFAASERAYLIVQRPEETYQEAFQRAAGVFVPTNTLDTRIEDEKSNLMALKNEIQSALDQKIKNQPATNKWVCLHRILENIDSPTVREKYWAALQTHEKEFGYKSLGKHSYKDIYNTIRDFEKLHESKQYEEELKDYCSRLESTTLSKIYLAFEWLLYLFSPVHRNFIHEMRRAIPSDLDSIQNISGENRRDLANLIQQYVDKNSADPSKTAKINMMNTLKTFIENPSLEHWDKVETCSDDNPGWDQGCFSRVRELYKEIKSKNTSMRP